MQATTQVKLLCARVTAEDSQPRGAEIYVPEDEARRMFAAGIAEPVSLSRQPVVETAAIEPPENMSNESRKRKPRKQRIRRIDK